MAGVETSTSAAPNEVKGDPAPGAEVEAPAGTAPNEVKGDPAPGAEVVETPVGAAPNEAKGTPASGAEGAGRHRLVAVEMSQGPGARGLEETDCPGDRPHGRVGGVLGLCVMGLPFTISAGVGFVALAGASMREGLVLVSAFRDGMARGVPERQAIAQARLRPVLMTGTVAALGFLPMMLATGIGAEVRRPLADVVDFGMAGGMFLTLLALPVLYLLFGKRHAPEAESQDKGPAGDGQETPVLQVTTKCRVRSLRTTSEVEGGDRLARLLNSAACRWTIAADMLPL